MKAPLGRAAALPARGAAIFATLALHGAVVGTMALMHARQPGTPVTVAYRVNLVAAPAAAASAPAAAAPAPAPEPVATPEPVPAARTPAPKAAPPSPAAPTPAPRTPNPAPSTPTPDPRSPIPDPRPSAAPSATPGTGSDAATIRTEGVEFPFPGYLRNLVSQVYRRWRPQQGGPALEAEIFFYVHRDGSVTGIEFIRRSGAFGFDLEAQGAVEAAARAGAFGALPAGYAADVLPVSFFFSPRNVR